MKMKNKKIPKLYEDTHREIEYYFVKPVFVEGTSWHQVGPVVMLCKRVKIKVIAALSEIAVSLQNGSHILPSLCHCLAIPVLRRCLLPRIKTGMAK